jgi:lysophospholipase L1-like esterase
MSCRMLLGIVVMGLAGCGGGQNVQDNGTPTTPVVQPSTKADGPIVFIGDSITARWEDLAALVPNSINTGIGGQTSCEMDARFDQDVLAHKPSTVVILAGINDVYREESPSVMCISEMLSRAQAAGATVLLCTLLPNKHWEGSSVILTNEKGIDALVRFNSDLRGLANAFGVALVDYYPALLGADGQQDDRWFLDGSVHPNEDGYKIMWPVLQHALQESI